MFVRSPLALVALLALAVCAIALPESGSGLLLLTPALVLVLPLLVNFYPGEKAVGRLASWFSKVRRPEFRRVASAPLFAGFLLSIRSGFCAANGSRGPPLLSHS